MTDQNTETIKTRYNSWSQLIFSFASDWSRKWGQILLIQKHNQTSNQMHATGIKYAKLYAGRSC